MTIKTLMTWREAGLVIHAIIADSGASFEWRARKRHIERRRAPPYSDPLCSRRATDGRKQCPMPPPIGWPVA
ncbi:hypothetical protein, partial [uncultured Lamprocystis sp.]|uniref:hypothetical protein n=1 Tax=uncultured Lamprocystis sp. TaxID=543132 RepID=UPI0025CCFA49